jgi:hypothetical protein
VTPSTNAWWRRLPFGCILWARNNEHKTRYLSILSTTNLSLVGCFVNGCYSFFWMRKRSIHPCWCIHADAYGRYGTTGGFNDCGVWLWRWRVVTTGFFWILLSICSFMKK